MIGVLVFLLALPLSVYVLAGMLAILDGGSRATALIGLSLRLAVLCLLVVLTPADSRVWIGAAFLTVLILHTGTAVWLRRALRRGHWLTERVD